MTKKSGTRGSAALNEEMFHVKHRVFLRTLSLFQCATESPAEPAELVLRMFQLHDHRPREVVSPHRLVRLEFEEAREDRLIPRLNDRASPESQRSAPIQKNKNSAPHAPPKHSHSKTVNPAPHIP